MLWMPEAIRDRQIPKALILFEKTPTPIGVFLLLFSYVLYSITFISMMQQEQTQKFSKITNSIDFHNSGVYNC